MKVKVAGKLYDVVEIKKSLGITHYCIEDEPNHYDWVNNVEVIEDDEIKEEERRRGMNRKDYDCKDGFLYALSQTKECGKCRGYNSPWNSHRVERCIYVNQCKFYQTYKKDTKLVFHDYMNDIPLKWFRKCTLYRIKEGGEK